ncbi:MAG TPA: hypothetical protein VNO18_08565 [Xanthobacteraceae bacterium]|nr:hypothetical protein [Xanthobacteraceae bacterium]
MARPVRGLVTTHSVVVAIATLPDQATKSIAGASQARSPAYERLPILPC